MHAHHIQTSLVLTTGWVQVTGRRCNGNNAVGLPIVFQHRPCAHYPQHSKTPITQIFPSLFLFWSFVFYLFPFRNHICELSYLGVSLVLDFPFRSITLLKLDMV